MKTHEIKMKIKKESDLYEPLSPDKELSSIVISYLEQKISSKNTQDRVLLHIYSAEPVNEQNVRTALSAWGTSIEGSLERQRQINWARQLWMFAIGIIFTVLSVVLEQNENIVSLTVLSAIGGFAMWDAAQVWISENPVIKLKKKILQQLSDEFELRIEVEEQNS